MCKDNITFKRRPYESPRFWKNVGDKDPGKIEIGDEVVLYLDNDINSDNYIYAIITNIDPDNHIMGKINRANRYGAKGFKELEKGAIIKFQEINVFRFANFKKRS